MEVRTPSYDDRSNRRLKWEEKMEGFIVPAAMLALLLGAVFYVYSTR
jgi:hypothetical protein